MFSKSFYLFTITVISYRKSSVYSLFWLTEKCTWWYRIIQLIDLWPNVIVFPSYFPPIKICNFNRASNCVFDFFRLILSNFKDAILQIAFDFIMTSHSCSLGDQIWLKLITFKVKIVITIKPELMEYSRNSWNLLWISYDS